MRKIIEKAEVCKECGAVHKRETSELHCDICDALVDWSKRYGCLEARLFYHNGNTDEYHFCSWNHYFKWINNFFKKKVEKEGLYFLSQPNINEKNYEEYFQTLMHLWMEVST